MTSPFGNIVLSSDIERSIINTLIKWYPTYLREIERQYGLKVDTIDTPLNYSNRNSFDANPGEQLPKVVVIAPGLAGVPTKNGRGQYRATWQVGVGIAVAARDEVICNMLVKSYGAATRALILQCVGKDVRSNESSLPLSNVTWVGETYDDLPIPNEINLFKSAGILFNIDLDDVVTSRLGPVQPSNPGPVGQVASIVIDINKIDLPEDINGD